MIQSTLTASHLPRLHCRWDPLWIGERYKLPPSWSHDVRLPVRHALLPLPVGRAGNRSTPRISWPTCPLILFVASGRVSHTLPRSSGQNSEGVDDVSPPSSWTPLCLLWRQTISLQVLLDIMMMARCSSSSAGCPWKAFHPSRPIFRVSFWEHWNSCWVVLVSDPTALVAFRARLPILSGSYLWSSHMINSPRLSPATRNGETYAVQTARPVIHPSHDHLAVTSKWCDLAISVI